MNNIQSEFKNELDFPEICLTQALKPVFLTGSKDNSHTLLSILDKNGRIEHLSPAWEKLLGTSLSIFSDIFFSELAVNPEDISELLDTAAANGVSQTTTDLLVKDEGISFSHYLIQRTCPNGTKQGFLCISGKTTSWDDYDENFVRVDRLAEIGRMSAAVVHELKNPLSVISQAAGWGETVLRDAAGLDQNDRNELSNVLREVERQTSRSWSIIQQILDLVRESKPEHKKFSLRELVENTLEYLSSEIKTPAIKINPCFPAGELIVRSDYTLLQQVLMNLLSNAVHAIRETNKKDGRIDIIIENLPTKFRIGIIDNGPGIPGHMQDRIFDLFFTTKTKGKGTGLGLSVSKRLIKRLGGSIQFKSTPEKGTAFSLLIPKNPQTET
ncbi:MAG: PAS domain-containing sensor histidine kinase [Thermodesulfobacteriota bacterium]